MKMKKTSPAILARRRLRQLHANGNTTQLPLILKQSSIHAFGCYTTKPIRSGVDIVEYTGTRLTVKDADEIYEKSAKTYLFGLTDGKHVIDGENEAAFINHSCDPNCEADEIKGKVIITACRDIKAGEELTYDYNLYDGELDDRSLCHCGAANCRGSMYSEKELARRNRLEKKKLATNTKKTAKKN
jgi:SET domain-containing protein